MFLGVRLECREMSCGCDKIALVEGIPGHFFPGEESGLRVGLETVGGLDWPTVRAVKLQPKRWPAHRTGCGQEGYNKCCLRRALLAVTDLGRGDLVVSECWLRGCGSCRRPDDGWSTGESLCVQRPSVLRKQMRCPGHRCCSAKPSGRK